MANEHIYKSHNKRLPLYHFVFPVKYRHEEIRRSLKKICVEINECYEIDFIEIGHGKPCVFVGTVCAEIKCYEDNRSDKKHNAKGIVLSASKN